MLYSIFSVFQTAEAWISLVTLIFLEIVLGVDNLVFITITCNRLPKDKESLGRKLGLLGALLSRCIFLCFASALVHLTSDLFSFKVGDMVVGLSIRDIILLLGGIYLIYKGIAELRSVLALTEEKEEAEDSSANHGTHKIGLPRAIGTIMVMDVVFSIDSVITAVGLADHLIVMVLAVMIAVIIMILFIDPISNYINAHTEMKILALAFITVIGILLVLDALEIKSGIMLLDMDAEKLMVYFAMVFSVVITLIQMRYSSNRAKWLKEQGKEGVEG